MKIYKAPTKEKADKIIDKLITSDGVPFVMSAEYWLNSQFSVARFYGGMTYNGVHYQIDYDTGDLVRSDCYELYIKFYKTNRSQIKEVKCESSQSTTTNE